MIKERFRTNYNIFGNNISEETESEFESETPFNTQMLQTTKQVSYQDSIRDLSESTSLQQETNLFFEDRLEQESPFRIIQSLQNEQSDYITTGEEAALSPFRHYLVTESLESSEPIPKNLIDDLCSILAQGTTMLNRGSRGREVEALQRALVLLAIDISPGTYGPKTEALVKELQTNLGLEANGIVGPKLRYFFCEHSKDDSASGGRIGAFRALTYRNTDDTSALSRRLCTAQTILRRGSEGQEVTDVQRCLTQMEVLSTLKAKANLGLYNNNLYDGIFGPSTEAAVRRFQIDERLNIPTIHSAPVALGVVGLETRNALCNALKQVSVPISKEILANAGNNLHLSGRFKNYGKTTTTQIKAGREVNFIIKNESYLSVLTISISELAKRGTVTDVLDRRTFTINPGKTWNTGFHKPEAKEPVEWIFDFTLWRGMPTKTEWHLLSPITQPDLFTREVKQGFYLAPEDLNQPTTMRTETNLFFEDRLEQESPFRSIQYTDKYTEDETPHEIANRLTKGKPYVPGNLSKLYQDLQPQERTKIVQEVNQKFGKLIGDYRLVPDPKNSKDRSLRTLWLQLRDDVMRERFKTSREFIAPPVRKPQALSITTKFTSKSPCLELKTVDDPSKSKFPYEAGFYEYNVKNAKGCAYYPAESAALNSPFHSSLKPKVKLNGESKEVPIKVPIVFIAPGKPWGSYYDPDSIRRSSYYDPNTKKEKQRIEIKYWSKYTLRPNEKGQGPPQGWKYIATYKGFEYFQQKLAKQGIIAVCVDFASADEDEKFFDLPAVDLVERKRELIVASIKYFMERNTDPKSPFYNHIDFGSVGLMGHSQGGEAAILVEERKDQIITSGSIRIRGVLALAPTDMGCPTNNCSSLKYSGYAFMTILPASDGDTFDNDGAKYYDRAIPERFKIQLYVHGANHNYFNSQWLFWDDSYGPNSVKAEVLGGGKELKVFDDKDKLPLPIMTPDEHQQVLSVYGCAFFRRILQSDNDMNLILNHWRVPAGVKSDNVRFSFQWYLKNEIIIVDDYEQQGDIKHNTLGGNTSQFFGLTAKKYPFKPMKAAYNDTFFGDTTGMIIKGKGIFRSQFYKYINGKTIYRSDLEKVARDLTGKAVYVRAAEVYYIDFDKKYADKPDDIKTGFKDKDRLGFELGLKDINGFRLWVHSDAVGGLCRPYYRGNPFENGQMTPTFHITKTMLETLRFPSECFKRQDSRLDIKNIVAILIRTNLVGKHALAFDDLQIW